MPAGPFLAPCAAMTKEDLREAEAEVGPWIERFARFGYAAKGLVYLLVGGIAIKAAAGSARPADSRGAMSSLLGGLAGQLLLGGIALGLFAYALWRLYIALMDPERRGAGQRLYSLGSAMIHGGLGFTAMKLALGMAAPRHNGGDQKAASWTSSVLQHDHGAWIIAAIGAGFVGYGIYQLLRAWRAKLDRMLHLHALQPTARTWAVRIARFGIAARGIVFAIIGTLLVRAALHYRADEAKGIAGALDALRGQPYGPWLLGVVALGLMGYGIYELLRARYRWVPVGHHPGDEPRTRIKVSRRNAS